MSDESKEFEIWQNGYSVNGDYDHPRKLGVGYGNTFTEACLEFMSSDRASDNTKKFFDPVTLAVWGCALTPTYPTHSLFVPEEVSDYVGAGMLTKEEIEKIIDQKISDAFDDLIQALLTDTKYYTRTILRDAICDSIAAVSEQLKCQHEN